MKNYFVYFTYRKLLPHSQELTEPQLTFEIIALQDTPETTAQVLFALANRGYKEDVKVIHMNPL